jgi:HPt (histidine-containing phosphotransfer) domain-containing protein
MGNLDNKAFEELKKQYISSFPEKVELLLHALESKDYQTIENFGHRLRGSGMSYGYPELSKIGTEIELAGNLAQSIQLSLLIDDLKSTLNKISLQHSSSEDC